MKLAGLLRLVPVVLALFAPSTKAITFPAAVEIDIVFPRNDSFAPVSPFPIVLALQSADAIFGFSSQLDYEVTCVHGSVMRFGHVQWDDVSSNVGAAFTPAPTDPFFLVLNATAESSINKEFEFWRGTSDACMLSWKFSYFTNCTRDADGSLTIGGGEFDQTGSLNFSLALGAPPPADAISAYKDCPTLANTFQVEANLTGCPHIGDTVPTGNPCAIKVESIASSLVAQLPTPTTTFVPTSTSSPTGTGAGSGAGPSSTPPGAAPRNINLEWGLGLILLLVVLAVL